VAIIIKTARIIINQLWNIKEKRGNKNPILGFSEIDLHNATAMGTLRKYIKKQIIAVISIFLTISIC